jgi:hypothetical protein
MGTPVYENPRKPYVDLKLNYDFANEEQGRLTRLDFREQFDQDSE